MSECRTPALNDIITHLFSMKQSFLFLSFLIVLCAIYMLFISFFLWTWLWCPSSYEFKWSHSTFFCIPSKRLSTEINNLSHFLSCFLIVQETAFYYLFVFSKTFVVKKQKKLSFSISLENTCMALLWLLGERFREFHLTPVGFLFLFRVCNLLCIWWLFSCLMVTELLWKTPRR